MHANESFTFATGGLVACVLVLLSASIFLLHSLGSEPIQDYDEATYAEVVHEALVSHNYLSYTEGSVPFLEKPPLGFWAMEISESVLGEHAFAMRLPFALFGVATLFVLMLLVYEVSASTWAAALSGAILATMPPFMEAVRQVRLDVPLVLCIVLAVYFFVRGLKNPKWFVAFGAALGLAIMTKSVVAVFALAAALYALLLYRRFDVLANKYLYWGAAACIAIAAPWHVWEWAHFGNLFWSRYIGFNVIDRTQENLFWTVKLTNADYVWFLLQFTRPWLDVFAIALAAVSVGWRRVPEEIRRFIGICVATIATILAVFFVAKTKAPTYLLPMYPFVAAVIALMVASIRTRWLQIAVGALCAALLVFAAQTTHNFAYHQDPYFSVVMHMAKDEEEIGGVLLPVPQSVPVYVFEYPNLGSIAYHSRHLRILKLTATSTPPTMGSYVIVATQALEPFSATFPSTQTNLLYKGPQVSLLKINK